MRFSRCPCHVFLIPEQPLSFRRCRQFLPYCQNLTTENSEKTFNINKLKSILFPPPLCPLWLDIFSAAYITIPSSLYSLNLFLSVRTPICSIFAAFVLFPSTSSSVLSMSALSISLTDNPADIEDGVL